MRDGESREKSRAKEIWDDEKYIWLRNASKYSGSLATVLIDLQ